MACVRSRPVTVRGDRDIGDRDIGDKDIGDRDIGTLFTSWTTQVERLKQMQLFVNCLVTQVVIDTLYMYVFVSVLTATHKQ